MRIRGQGMRRGFGESMGFTKWSISKVSSSRKSSLKNLLGLVNRCRAASYSRQIYFVRNLNDLNPVLSSGSETQGLYELLCFLGRVEFLRQDLTFMAFLRWDEKSA